MPDAGAAPCPTAPGSRRRFLRQCGVAATGAAIVPWLRAASGATYSDNGYPASWEVSRGQPSAAGILVGYSGGLNADTFSQGTAEPQAAGCLGQIEPVLPGLAAAFNGRATVDCWRRNAFSRGSYAYWQVGQYTRFAGSEGPQEGNAQFCGEHTSIDSQGYLNGATENGERVAGEIIRDLGR